MLEEAGNDALLDATVPGGAKTATTKAGWKGGAGKFTYRNAGTVTLPAGGIRKIALKLDARGRLSLKVVAKRSTVAIASADLPLQAWIALDPPTAETRACVGLAAQHAVRARRDRGQAALRVTSLARPRTARYA